MYNELCGINVVHIHVIGWGSNDTELIYLFLNAK
jgi:hypothetical protein